MNNSPKRKAALLTAMRQAKDLSPSERHILDFIFENLQKLLSDGIPVEFFQIEDVLAFTITPEDALGHYRISIEIKTPETFIKTFFIMSYYDIERMLPRR